MKIYLVTIREGVGYRISNNCAFTHDDIRRIIREYYKDSSMCSDSIIIDEDALEVFVEEGCGYVNLFHLFPLERA